MDAKLINNTVKRERRDFNYRNIQRSRDGVAAAQNAERSRALAVRGLAASSVIAAAASHVYLERCAK
jgi:hypothetical protein